MKKKMLFVAVCAAVLFVALLAVFIIKKGVVHGAGESPTRGVQHTENTNVPSSTQEEKELDARVMAPTPSPTYGVTPGSPTYGVTPGSPTYGWTPGDYSWIELDRYFGMKGKRAYDFGPSLYDKNKTAEDYDKELREMIENEDGHHDVILGVSAKYYLSVVLGKNRQATDAKDVSEIEKEVNGLIAKYVSSNSRAYEVKIADEVFSELDTAKSIKVEKRKISDMFYQDHFNLLPDLDVEVPSVMIMEPRQDEIWALVYTFEKDGVEREAVFSVSKSFAPASITRYVDVEPGEWRHLPAHN